ncbi:MAG TPA: anaerobic ribonucleoside-triphosphate reductase activating protein [Dictyoglomaceae bacterium]|nr:anaerobic ribonucleoside-triphosphate reductase activating protein [Dictyoglomaceae bacterium]HOL39347.1 anaerobic ribonucleoside-triphosphate reductase activating protein [Dictyoglomaceae bacterium]HOP94832.1 anaerobic ribonucleoside-triphosphate reductase activating protein [Dictyoglomaceae bacterium]HPP15971.1 anaerobic ribonucleoside-triphosphate reductase activating protein [Dictyoglomaceae bacterium]HPU43008.1 anaerobic ribonucleoside-triphosphate reductase activating protein [Dictyogl
MKISGYLGFSLIDYPGKTSLVVFTQGCNFRCPFCHNPELVSTRKKGTYSEEFIIEEIERRRKLIQGVVITGGEPTIQEDLPSFLFKLKRKRLSIKLDTNGSNPKMLIELIKGKLIDYVALDFKTSLKKYFIATGLSEKDAQKHVKNLLESLKILKESSTPFEVRTTVVPKIVEENDLINIREIIGDLPYFLQDFRPEKTLSYKLREEKPYPKEILAKWNEEIKSSIRGYF